MVVPPSQLVHADSSLSKSDLGIPNTVHIFSISLFPQVDLLACQNLSEILDSALLKTNSCPTYDGAFSLRTLLSLGQCSARFEHTGVSIVALECAEQSDETLFTGPKHLDSSGKSGPVPFSLNIVAPTCLHISTNARYARTDRPRQLRHQGPKHTPQLKLSDQRKRKKGRRPSQGPVNRYTQPSPNPHPHISVPSYLKTPTANLPTSTPIPRGYLN